MTFDYKPHLMDLKGKKYLPVAPRIAWLREEHPDAHIETSLIEMDLTSRMAIFRAVVTIPEGGSATGYGSQTEKSFPLGWVEKAETKAIGRAIAALGYGTLMALELDEEDD